VENGKAKKNEYVDGDPSIQVGNGLIRIWSAQYAMDTVSLDAYGYRFCKKSSPAVLVAWKKPHGKNTMRIICFIDEYSSNIISKLSKLLKLAKNYRKMKFVPISSYQT
jgi:hypothetical protein